MREPAIRLFKPAGVPGSALDRILLSLDEFEALRLADYEGLYHEAAALRMGVSRQTFGRILEGARRKVADVLVNGRALLISGGPAILRKEGESKTMKIAVPTQDGDVYPHFGSCKTFTIFSVENGKIVDQKALDVASGLGCRSNSASLLAREGVTLMIAGGMGEGAARVLASFGVSPLRGASGNAVAAVEGYIAGTLADSGVPCAGHEGGHDCGHDHDDGHDCSH